MGGGASKQDVAVAAASFFNTDAAEFGSKDSRARLRSLANVSLTQTEVEKCFPAQQIAEISTDKWAVLFSEILSVAEALAEKGTYGVINGNEANQVLTVVRLLRHFIRVLLARDSRSILQVRLLSSDSREEVLAVRISILLERLLFVQGFTVSCGGLGMAAGEALPRHKLDSRFNWYISPLTTTELEDAPQPLCRAALTLARVEVLETLACLWSSALYEALDEFEGSPVALGLAAVTDGNLPFTANLFCNLLTAVARYCTNFTSAGWTSGGPSNAETREAAAATTLLCLLADFQPPSSSSRQSTPGDGKDKQQRLSPAPRNVFRLMMAGMKRPTEIEWVLSAITAALQSVVDCRRGLFRRKSPIPFFRELLLLLWNLLTLNAGVLEAAVNGEHALKLIAPIMLLLVESSDRRSAQCQEKRRQLAEGKEAVVWNAEEAEDGGTTVEEVRAIAGVMDQEDAQGLLHLCSFVLLVLSAERPLAVALNAPFRASQFPAAVLEFEGAYVDLVVVGSYKVIRNSIDARANGSVISMLLTAICNVSSYVKGFSSTSCVALLDLFRRFSRPAWLFRANYNYHTVLFLLDIFNNCIQYHYEGNTCLVYSILRRAEDFRALNDLQFSGELSAAAAPGGWTPSAAWFHGWKEQMPIDTCLRLIECLLPLVERECDRRELLSQQQVEEFIRATTVVGLLPVPHAIIVRNYQANAFTALWFSSYLWCCVARWAIEMELVDPQAVRMIQRGHN